MAKRDSTTEIRHLHVSDRTQVSSRDQVLVNQETWKEWGAERLKERSPEELLTRDELFEKLQERGVSLNLETFRSWEKYGLLPRAVRQWHEGAVRALYPPWMVGLTALTHSLLSKGWTRDEVKGAFDRVREPDDHSDLDQYLLDISLKEIFLSIDVWGWNHVALNNDERSFHVQLVVTDDQGNTVVEERRSYGPSGK
jgi:hypothetical protein